MKLPDRRDMICLFRQLQVKFQWEMNQKVESRREVSKLSVLVELRTLLGA